ncbi:MAG: DUF1385 domain-containing protein [Thermoleophilia bacterium]|nr:DUF1385 domain-containing protein [Thermoleophilia bacterium]
MATHRDREPMQLAGMALRNGVLVLGPTSWAVAIRLRDGSIRTTTRPRPTGGERVGRRIPLLRGPVALANMLRVLPAIRRTEPAARLGIESPGIIATLVAGSVLTGQLRRRSSSPIVGELVAGSMSLALTLATMRTGEVAAYHGAEHKAIGGYEQGIAAAEAPREHPRCGTQLALPMLVLSSLATQAALLAAPRHPRTARNVGQLAGVALATELFRSAQRGHGTALARAAARAGLALQTHATTAEPTREQLDVAEAALKSLLAAEARTAA